MGATAVAAAMADRAIPASFLRSSRQYFLVRILP
jgi:hypothetical protein